VYWNMMHDAWYFSIATLPDTAKAAITEHLRSADVPPRNIVQSLIALQTL
jgi:hypothetical protein